MPGTPEKLLHRRLRALPLLLAFALAGCASVGPDYQQPQANVPAAWKEAPTTATQGLSEGDLVAPAGDPWWRVFDDPTLDALLDQVQVNNQTLAAAAARVSEAQHLLTAAGGASLPAINAGTFQSGRSNQTDFGIGASWEPDLWGRVRRDVEAHRASADASADDLAAATLSLQAQVAQTYFALRQQDAAITLQQQAAAVDTEAHTIARNQFARGQVSSADVANAEVRLSKAQQQLADMRSTRAQLEHALAVMLGKAPADFSLAPASFDTRVPTVPVGLPATLLQRRPDIAARERQMAAASARIGVSKADTLPSVKLFAGLGVLNGPTIVPSIRWPLFAGGRIDALVDNARAGYQEAQANWRQTVLDALREVEDGLVQERTLAHTATLQTRAVQAAQEAARVARNQYREGIIDFPAVASAAGAALEAEQGALQLHRQRLDASVDLIKALGGGWQPEPRPTDASVSIGSDK